MTYVYKDFRSFIGSDWEDYQAIFKKYFGPGITVKDCYTDEEWAEIQSIRKVFDWFSIRELTDLDD